MPATLSTVSAITKEIYGSKLQKQLNDDAVLINRIKSDSSNVVTEVGGKYVTFPIHTRRNTGIGARNENEALPAAGQQGYAGARIGLKYQYGAVELTGQTIDLVDTNPQAFVSALDFEVERLRVDLNLDLNRQVFGTQTGTIASFPIVTTASTTVNVNDSSLFELGMLVDIVNLTTGAVNQAGRTITAIPSATTVTISGANVTTTTAEGFVRSGNWNREWTGLTSIIATSGVLHNVDPAVEPVWTANVDSNGGTLRSMSEGLWNLMSDNIKQRGGKVTAIYTSYGVRRAYANLLQQQRSYVNTNGKFDGGYKSLAYATPDGDVPIIIDRMAPKNKAFFVNEDAIKLYRESDWKWMQHGGGDIWRLKNSSGNDFDAYIARLVQYSDLGTDRRNTHGLVADITEN